MEISEKHSLWEVDISPTGNLNTRWEYIEKTDVYINHNYLGCILFDP